MKTAVTIAGSDSSGGAGIQADIKTMMANGVYAMSAITALTAQNTTGVMGILNATPEFLGQELDSIFTDIFPDAVKIGMVSEKGLICVIAEKLEQYKAKNIVVDPVMVATSHGYVKTEIISTGHCSDTKHSGGRSADRNENQKRRGYDPGSRADFKGV